MIDYVLIKFRKNYADEFDITGFHTSTKEEWEQEKRQVEAFFFKNPTTIFEFYFGTNQALYYKRYSNWLNACTVVDITVEEFNLLQKLFPAGNFGHTAPLSDDFALHLEDEEYWNEDHD